MNVQDVFTPGDFPEYTYVERGQGDLESRLEHQLRRSGAVISISGPSKSGKSVLVEQVVGEEDLVSVYGGDIDSVEGLWDQVLDSLGAPKTQESVSGTTEETQTTTNVGIRSHIFSAGGEKSESKSSNDETVEIYERRGLDDVIEVNEKDSFVLLIDDFHYVDADIRQDIGETIKQASEEGLRICVALIPHRSDDIIQANPDLQGRALTLELDYWNKEDLIKIGEKGFRELNVNFPQQVLDVFAKESVGSPHLMQQICYDSCGLKGITEQQDDNTDVKISAEDIEDVLGWTGASLDMEGVFAILNGEGISGGKERKMHEFNDGSEGDVYEAILRGIAADPIEVNLDRSDLMNRIENQCVDGSPHIPSVTQAIERMDERIAETFPEQDYLEWDGERHTLDVPDPYLIFYLRWSDKLKYEPEVEV
jgi:hypothetical protein